MSAPKPVYVASDVHYGATRPEHERAFLSWLRHAAAEASAIVINGDLFDFWFEFRSGVPPGYDELLALLAEVAGSGLPVTLMGGNHDWWGGRYLREEIGVEFLRDPVVRRLAGRAVLLAHGDGLGERDRGYRWVVRPLLRSPLTRTAFGMLPVGIGDAIAARTSRTSRRWTENEDHTAHRSDAVEAWAVRTLEARPELDLVLLGHTHRPLAREVAPGRWYVNSGDWVLHNSYVTLSEGCPPALHDWRERP